MNINPYVSEAGYDIAADYNSDSTVTLYVTDGDRATHAFISPAAAREVARRLLNAANEAEGN